MQWWQVVPAYLGLIITIPAAIIGILAYRRSAAAQDAESRSQATEIGLDYMKASLAALQDQNLRQQGEIGELRGQLKDCRTERQAMAEEIDELKRRFPS